jgi:His-Xaa-Ser system protein HxsD
MESVSNIEFYQDGNYALISVNPKTYSLSTVYSAAYTFIEKAYVLIEGDPSEEIIVEIRPKDKQHNAKQFAFEFNNELLHYALYETNTKRNTAARDIILKRALSTNDGTNNTIK